MKRRVQYGLGVTVIVIGLLVPVLAALSQDALPTEFEATQVAKYASAWTRAAETAAVIPPSSKANSGFEAVVLPSHTDVVFACDAPLAPVKDRTSGWWTAQVGDVNSWGRYRAPNVAEPTLDLLTYPSDPPLHVVILIEPTATVPERPTRTIRQSPIWDGRDRWPEPSPLIASSPRESSPLPPRPGRVLREKISLERTEPYGRGYLIPVANARVQRHRAWILDNPPGPPPPPPLRTVRLGPVFADPGRGRDLVAGPLEIRAIQSGPFDEYRGVEPLFWSAWRTRLGVRLPYLPLLHHRRAQVAWTSRRIMDRYATVGGRRVYVGTAFVWGRDFAMIDRPRTTSYPVVQDGVPDRVQDAKAILLP